MTLRVSIYRLFSLKLSTITRDPVKIKYKILLKFVCGEKGHTGRSILLKATSFGCEGFSMEMAKIHQG